MKLKITLYSVCLLMLLAACQQDGPTPEPSVGSRTVLVYIPICLTMPLREDPVRYGAENHGIFMIIKAKRGYAWLMIIRFTNWKTLPR